MILYKNPASNARVTIVRDKFNTAFMEYNYVNDFHKKQPRVSCIIFKSSGEGGSTLKS